MPVDVTLYTISALHLATGEVHPLRYATIPGYRSWPTDTPASTVWWPRVVKAPDLVLSIGVPGEGRGASTGTEGRLVLANTLDRQGGGAGERPLNALVTDYVLAGRPIVEQVVRSDQPYSTAVTTFRGVCGGDPDPERGAITITVKDRSSDFDNDLIEQTYLGTGGMEGPEALKDKTVERCIGHVAFMEPTYLGIIDGLHTFRVNGGHPIEEVEAFGNAGAARPRTTGTPSGEQWSFDPATGVIRAGGATRPDTPWARVKGDKTGGVWRRYLGEVLVWVVNGMTGRRTIEQVDVAAAAALDAATPRTVGRFIAAGESLKVRDILDELAASVWGGFWTEGALSTFRVGRLPATGGTVAATYRARAGCDPLKPVSSSRATPAKKVTWQYARNFAVTQSPADAAATDEATRAKAEWLEEATAENAAIATAYGSAARHEKVPSLLYHKADAAAEAALAAADLATPARTYELSAWDRAPGIDLTAEVQAFDDIAGFDGPSGGRLVIIGRNLRRRGGRATLIGIT